MGVSALGSWGGGGSEQSPGTPRDRDTSGPVCPAKPSHRKERRQKLAQRLQVPLPGGVKEGPPGFPALENKGFPFKATSGERNIYSCLTGTRSCPEGSGEGRPREGGCGFIACNFSSLLWAILREVVGGSSDVS